MDKCPIYMCAPIAIPIYTTFKAFENFDELKTNVKNPKVPCQRKVPQRYKLSEILCTTFEMTNASLQYSNVVIVTCYDDMYYNLKPKIMDLRTICYSLQKINTKNVVVKSKKTNFFKFIFIVIK
jgi:hypothetical protein